MAEVVNSNVGTAAQPANPAAAQPAQAPSAPQIDPNEFSRLQRVEQQYKGTLPFVEKVRSYGLTDEKQVDAWGGFIRTANQRGFSPQNLSTAFGESGASQAGSAKEAIALTEEELDRRLTEREQKQVKAQYEREHQKALDDEGREFSDERLSKELEGEPPAFIKFAKYALQGMYMEARKPYGDDSPLKGMFGPAGRDGVNGIYTSLKSTLAELKTAYQAQQFAKVGDAARKSPNQTVAGAASTQGRPSTTPTDTRPGGKPSVAAVEEAAERRRLARSAR